MKKRRGFAFLKEGIIDNGLCCRCGACVGICPVDCLAFTGGNDFTPILKIDHCIKCGKCNQVCPGEGYKILDKKEGVAFDEKIGCYRKIYTGYSTNNCILENCASGGIITSLLVYLFQKKEIDFALVVTNVVDGDKNHRYAEGLLAKGVEDVLQASQSKYANVATLNLIREIKNKSAYQKGAVVGVPCQLAAIANIMELEKDIEKKVLYKIGLFCGYTYTDDCFDYLFRYMGTASEKVKAIEGWRCNGIPGDFQIKTMEKEKAISYQEEHSLNTILFAQNRCMLCEDCFAEYCDIAVGDVGHNEYRDSLVIVRTLEGEKVLSEAWNHGAVALTERSYQYLMDKTIVNFMVREKREKVEIRKNIYARNHLKTVDWKNTQKKNSVASFLVVYLQYLARKEKIKNFILKTSKRHYRMGKFLYLGLENSIFIRGLRKIERSLKNG